MKRAERSYKKRGEIGLPPKPTPFFWGEGEKDRWETQLNLNEITKERDISYVPTDR